MATVQNFELEPRDWLSLVKHAVYHDGTLLPDDFERIRILIYYYFMLRILNM